MRIQNEVYVNVIVLVIDNVDSRRHCSTLVVQRARAVVDVVGSMKTKQKGQVYPCYDADSAPRCRGHHTKSTPSTGDVAAAAGAGRGGPHPLSVRTSSLDAAAVSRMPKEAG